MNFHNEWPPYNVLISGQPEHWISDEQSEGRGEIAHNLSSWEALKGWKTQILVLKTFHNSEWNLFFNFHHIWDKEDTKINFTSWTIYDFPPP